jgi:hypothetical protein
MGWVAERVVSSSTGEGWRGMRSGVRGLPEVAWRGVHRHGRLKPRGSVTLVRTGISSFPCLHGVRRDGPNATTTAVCSPLSKSATTSQPRRLVNVTTGLTLGCQRWERGWFSRGVAPKSEILQASFSSDRPTEHYGWPDGRKGGGPSNPDIHPHPIVGNGRQQNTIKICRHVEV